MKEKSSGVLNISKRSFITALVVIFALMTLTYIATLFIPGGEFPRITDSAGNTVIDPNGDFNYTKGGISFVKWLLSPFLVLTSSGGGSIIVIIAFLIVIGGVFNCLDKCTLLKYFLDITINKFGNVRYRLMAILVFMFMALGAMIGSFEECVPLIPIVTALSVRLGWDRITGVGMSLLAAGCGFAAGVCNPFTVGVAQNLAGLPMFSGISLRILSFVLIYALLFAFLFFRAKRIESASFEFDGDTFERDRKMDRAVLSFLLIIGSGITLVLLSAVITALQDYTMVIVAVMFFAAGIVSSLAAGMNIKKMLAEFLSGALTMIPAAVMILMASSIKYTLDEAKILDTILHEAVEIAYVLPKWSVILFIYLIVLVMNFFIASGSAKAFLLMPLIVPLAQIFGISAQLCVVAFAFGDGFSNVIYPTNPVLLISLGLADVSYGDWFKWSLKFQIVNLILTSSLLLFGLAIGY